MPIYEYVCTACTHRFEKMRPASQCGEAAVCPRCQNAANRVLSSFSSFSKDASGVSAPIAGSSSGCATCGGGSCATCGG